MAPFGFSRVVFLSHVLGPGSPVFPGDPVVSVRPVATVPRDGYYLQTVVTGEQSGTHWAAPAHFHLDGLAADELEAGDFFFPAVVLDVRAEAAEDADFVLGRGEVEKWEANFGPVPAGSAVLAWTGFASRWDDPGAYLNADAAGVLHHPGFGVEVTRWLISERLVGALGIDAMGIDPGADTSFGANQVLLHGHRLHLENLTGLGEMPPAGGWIIVGGMRVRGGSGSPATVFGLIP